LGDLRSPNANPKPAWLRRAVIVGFAACALFALENPCFAEPKATLPSDCGTAEEFEGEVRRRLSKGISLPDTSLEIVPEGAVYRLRMSVGGEQRELEDADCRQLFRAAVVVAVAVTLSQRERPPSETRRAPAPTAPTPKAEDPAPPRRASNLEVALALGGGFNLGLLPEIALALELQGKSVFYDRFGVALSARYLFPRSAEKDSQGRGLTASAAGAQLLGVYRPLAYMEAGLGGSVYRLSGEGEGVGQRSDTAWGGGPNMALSFLPLPSGPLWLALGTELQWNVIRPTFEFASHGPIFTSSRFDFSVFLRLGPRFR
jgi:hypothetical protein